MMVRLWGYRSIRIPTTHRSLWFAPIRLEQLYPYHYINTLLHCPISKLTNWYFKLYLFNIQLWVYSENSN